MAKLDDLTTRDVFAAFALVAIHAQPDRENRPVDASDAATQAYQLADALLSRKKDTLQF